MKRREFIAALGGATAWPVIARAQDRQRIRLIGVIVTATADNPEFHARMGAFQQGLQELGWGIGHDVRLETRWTGAKVDDIGRHAAQLAALAPDVIVAHGASAVRAAQQATRTVPIVFPVAGDPVGAGLVNTLARPGGNVTGFMNIEFSMGAKWLELLSEIAPDVKRAAVLRDTAEGSGTSQFAAVQAAAASLRMEVTPVNMRDAAEIERDIEAFARGPKGGLIVTAGAASIIHRELIIKLASRNKLPTIYFERSLVDSGGLMSYGPDYIDQYRRTAGYVDRILKGENPADLPVQAPTKFELVINLKTAKALGLTVPPTMFARADEVIE